MPGEQERVFNSFRIKVYRPFYSKAEFRAGMMILLVLAAVTAWVLWRGAHPEAGLFVTQEKLLTSRGAKIPIYETPLQRFQENSSPAPGGTSTAGNPYEPFPAGVVSSNWQAAAPVQMFDETNLYIKIDGRESFYKSFGFKKLYYLSLQSGKQKNLTIDMELFDLGTAENTLGAFSAENSGPNASVQVQNGSLLYFSGNSGFLAQNRYYARLLGSDDNPAIHEAIQTIVTEMNKTFPAGKLPWTYELFAASLGASPGTIKYQKENAFSFGFATDVYSAIVPGSKETEVFVLKRNSSAEAADLAKKFASGFGGYGSALKSPAGHPEAMLFKNEFINTVEGAESFDNYVLGIRFATSPEQAVLWMGKLKSALAKPPKGALE